MCGYLARMSEEGRSVRGMPSHDASCFLFLVAYGILWVRHAMFVDQKNENVVVPFNEFLESKSRLELSNSGFFRLLGYSYQQLTIYPFLGSLSEVAVLGVSLSLRSKYHRR